MQFSLLLLVGFVVDASSYMEVAYLGDICAPPHVPCLTPNSQCIHTDNIFYDRQSFCICMPGFEPSTGHCISDEEDTTTTTTTTKSTTTANAVIYDASNSTDEDNSTVIVDTQPYTQQSEAPTRRSQVVRRPYVPWPKKTGKSNKLPPNNPIYEPPFPTLTTSINTFDEGDQNFQAAYSTTESFLHLRFNPYPDAKNVVEKPMIVQEEKKVARVLKTPARDIAPELLAAVTTMSQMYDFRTITESPYKMKLPQPGGLFHNDIKPIPYQITTVEPSIFTKKDTVAESGAILNSSLHMSLDALLSNSKEKMESKSQARGASSESRSHLTRFFKNRYQNSAVSRLAMDPVNRGIDSLIRSSTTIATSVKTSIPKTSIYDMVKNSAPDIFNFVKSKIDITMINAPFLTTAASTMLRSKVDSTSKRDKESSNEHSATQKPKPLILKIVSSNSTNVIKKPRIIFNG